MSNQPVYRRPRGTDSYWERTRYNPDLRRDATYVAQNVGSGAGGWFWGILIGLCVLFWPSFALHGQTQVAASVAWYGAIGLGVIWWLVAVSVRQARRSRPPKGRLRVEATAVSQLKPPPASVCVPRPICLHRNAVKVNSSVIPGLIWQCWCPGCETPLPAAFRLPCCGTEPETPHLYNCPHLTGGPR